MFSPQLRPVDDFMNGSFDIYMIGFLYKSADSAKIFLIGSIVVQGIQLYRSI